MIKSIFDKDRVPRSRLMRRLRLIRRGRRFVLFDSSFAQSRYQIWAISFVTLMTQKFSRFPRMLLEALGTVFKW